MNRKDDSVDALMPEHVPVYERAALGTSSIIATVGLAGYISATTPIVAEFAPVVNDIPYLLGLSILAFGLGAGGFAFIFNLLVNPVASLGRAKKVSSVYLPMVGLLSALVNAGAFHPRLAMVFLALLSGTGILYALFHGESVVALGRNRV